METMATEHNSIYQHQRGYEVPGGEPAYGGSASASHLHGGSVRGDPRGGYRQEAPPGDEAQPQHLQQLRRSAPAGHPGHPHGLDHREAPRPGYSRGSAAQKYRKGLLGLTNLGNTCFMNAALQCLAHTHGLQKYFRFCSHVYTSKGQSNRQKLVMSFAHWFERDWGKNVSAQYHSPEDILRSVQQLNPIFQGYAQHDSQEFLRCVLDNIHEELRREVPDDLRAYLQERFGVDAFPGGASERLRTADGTEDAPAGHDPASSSSARPASGSSPTAGGKSTHASSIISELFQGHVVSTVRCLECRKTSRMKEPIFDVSVQIPNPNELSNGQVPLCDVQQPADGRGPSLTGLMGHVTGKVKSWFYDKGVEITDCLRKFCAPEHLTGKDKYDCEYCKRKTEGERRFAFEDLPEVLCIHIKRFRYDSNWYNATKNSRVVTFPVTKTLDMAPFLEESPQHPVEYRLIGLIQHIGSMGGGHYIAYCQHKKRDKEWYEFDDLQVTPVTPEQVERAEPYVLFYQRMPSKGHKLDRHTFKVAMRRMEDSVRQYLQQRSSPTSLAPPSKEDNAQASLADELRHHGPALRNLYRCPPDELEMAFVSKHWYVRLTTMSHYGPLDNYEYLCPHQLLGCSVEMAAEPFVPISRDLFKALVQKYGGGPPISALEVCGKCQTHLAAYNYRKQTEYELVSKYDTKDTGDGKGWYLVDALWVEKWKRYVRAEPVADIRDMSPPGPVTNTRLFDKNGAARANLRLRSDYIGVNARVWWLFMHVHGGGPAICREELDIYAAGHPLEPELVPDELRAAGELPWRASHQFVDGCKGDVTLYEHRHGVQPAREGRADAEMAEVREEAVRTSHPVPDSAAQPAERPRAEERQADQEGEYYDVRRRDQPDD